MLVRTLKIHSPIFRLTTAAVILLLSLNAHASPASSKDSCANSKQALMLAKVGKFPEATTCYERIVVENNHGSAQTKATDYFNLALLYQKQGQFEKARQYYQQVTSLKPNHQKALINLGAVLVSLHQPEAAIPILEQASTINGCNGNLHFSLGNAYSLRAKADSEWWKAAAASFERATECQPKMAFAHFNLGVARDNLKQTVLAEQSFATAMNLDPNILGRPDVANHFKVGHARIKNER
jgi:tetratricopeptide (TPR) repeat protein